jgi:hypothetical protein
MYLCTSVTVGIYIFLFQIQWFVRVTILPEICSIYGSSNKIFELEYLLGLSTSRYLCQCQTVIVKILIWQGFVFNGNTGNLRKIRWYKLINRQGHGTCNITLVVSGVRQQLQFFEVHMKFRMVSDVVPLSDRCQIHSEQVQLLGNLTQLQVKRPLNSGP